MDSGRSHGVCHPVDHVHNCEGEREDGPGVDVDGVGIDGFADTFGTALFPFLRLLRLPGPSPPRLRLLRAALSGDFTAGALGPALAAGNDHTLVHASDRKREENHGLFSILHNRL